MPKHVWLVELEINTDADDGSVPAMTEHELTKLLMQAWSARAVRLGLPYSIEAAQVVAGPREV